MKLLIPILFLTLFSFNSYSQLNIGLTSSIGYVFQGNNKYFYPSFKTGLTIEKNLTTILKISSNITYNRQSYPAIYFLAIPEYNKTKVQDELIEFPLNIGVLLNTKNESKNIFYLYTGYSFFYQFKSTETEIFIDHETSFVEYKTLKYHNINLGLEYVRLIKNDYFCSIGFIWQNGIPDPSRFFFNDLFINLKLCKTFREQENSIK